MTLVTRITRHILAATVLCAISANAAIAGGKNVVELYTSQGCSSCPPADALLKKYIARPDIVALSFNVDYWDYLGWKDTLGNKAYTERQRAYADARGDGQVYTPQIVANGMDHAVGSIKGRVDRAIQRSAHRLSGHRVTMTLKTDQSNFVITIGPGKKPAKPATIYIAAVSPKIIVKIKRGENHGRKIHYHNVVRNMIPVGMWTGEPTTIRLKRQDILQSGGKRCAVLLQTANAGPILAADWMPE